MPNLITTTRCLANLPPLAPRWLWKDRLPQGKIVLLAGPSGSGKTFIALDIAARITTNKGFPDPVPCNLSPTTCPLQPHPPPIRPPILLTFPLKWPPPSPPNSNTTASTK